MVESFVEVKNPKGLHARPAALFVQTAGRYMSDIWIIKDGMKVNAKSIMGLMSLAIAKGTEVNIRAEGEDEQTALKELVDLVTTGLME